MGLGTRFLDTRGDGSWEWTPTLSIETHLRMMGSGRVKRPSLMSGAGSGPGSGTVEITDVSAGGCGGAAACAAWAACAA